VNLFAEHLLKHLAYQKTGLGTTKDGCKFIEQFWKDKGLDLSGFFMNDGSGLSRFNGITASQIIGVLTYMKTKSKYADDFCQSLASVGNGTLTVFNPNSFPDDCLRAKSGSMTRVRCYAGYLTTVSGKQLSFAVMLNNFSCSQTEATKKIEELLLELRKM
jgi:D-alanyl-D-alanine carboxypeptidase/D-alanyl-D-alanine-endopeptidase (penicillin-binding protein 4)